MPRFSGFTPLSISVETSRPLTQKKFQESRPMVTRHLVWGLVAIWQEHVAEENCLLPGCHEAKREATWVPISQSRACPKQLDIFALGPYSCRCQQFPFEPQARDQTFNTQPLGTLEIQTLTSVEDRQWGGDQGAED